MRYLKNRIRQKVHALVFWQSSLGEIVNGIYGLSLFYRYRFTQKKLKSRENEKAFLTKQYHIVEKGLALPNPRPSFGIDKINILLSHSKRYEEKYGEDDLVKCIKGCLKEYIEFNEESGIVITGSYFESIINYIDSKKGEQGRGGTLLVEKDVLNDITSVPFEDFVKSRFSVRDFSDEDLDLERINEAVEIARYAPSVCNRQAWKVHVYTDAEQMLALLKIQGGNNGFTKSINKLLIVTSDIRAFSKLESNQLFIDGGLFSMNLILSLHSKGVGACCLNTCFPYTSEKNVKKIGGIGSNERLIMMIAVGNLKETYKVAISTKKNLDEIIKIN